MSFSKTRFMIAAFGACCLVISSGLSPAFGKDVKRYSIKSGEVHYKIEGSGNLMGTQISSRGEKSLYFKDYGNLMMEEETIRESTSGLAGNKQNTKHTMTKKDRDSVYNVNFDQKTIFTMRDPMTDMHVDKDMSKDAEKILKGFGGQKIGSDKVLGYSCTIWSLMGAKQCLYQNEVPLWLEVDIMGIKSRHTAVSAKFNHSVSDKYFQLPNYPIKKEVGAPARQENAGQEKNPMAAMMQALGQDMGQQNNENSTEQLMDMFGQNPQMDNELKTMQREMPIMLKLLKECRSCLQKADSQKEAQRCGQRMEQEIEKQGLSQEHEKNDEIPSWSAQDKKETLDELDEAIADLEKSMPCIKQAKTFADLINCPGTN